MTTRKPILPTGTKEGAVTIQRWDQTAIPLGHTYHRVPAQTVRCLKTSKWALSLTRVELIAKGEEVILTDGRMIESLINGNLAELVGGKKQAKTATENKAV